MKMVTRVDLHADRGTEEVLGPEFYALCGGVWIEDDACGGVRITCYPADPDRFCAYVRGSGVPVRLLTVEEEEEKDYVALVRRHFTPVKVGDLTILPPWRRRPRRGRTICDRAWNGLRHGQARIDEADGKNDGPRAHRGDERARYRVRLRRARGQRVAARRVFRRRPRPRPTGL